MFSRHETSLGKIQRLHNVMSNHIASSIQLKRRYEQFYPELIVEGVVLPEAQAFGSAPLTPAQKASNKIQQMIEYSGTEPYLTSLQNAIENSNFYLIVDEAEKFKKALISNDENKIKHKSHLQVNIYKNIASSVFRWLEALSMLAYASLFLVLDQKIPGFLFSVFAFIQQTIVSSMTLLANLLVLPAMLYSKQQTDSYNILDGKLSRILDSIIDLANKEIISEATNTENASL